MTQKQLLTTLEKENLPIVTVANMAIVVEDDLELASKAMQFLKVMRVFTDVLKDRGISWYSDF